MFNWTFPNGDIIRQRLTRLAADRRGSVSVYVGVFITVALGAVALAVDLGRVSLVGSQVQDTVDARVMAAATQLDGQSGAQSRAMAAATVTFKNSSQTTSEDGMQVAAVNFYSKLGDSPVAATGDHDSRYVEVVMAGQTVDHLFAPFLSNTNTDSTVLRQAIGGQRAYACNIAPLMLCDPGELDLNSGLHNVSNVGKQYRLKGKSTSGMAPGNFGLLATADGDKGASAIELALRAEEPAGCYGTSVTTATGSKTNKIANAINTRFDTAPSDNNPAPNVINYPRDSSFTYCGSSDVLNGSGDWDRYGYWWQKHQAMLPAALASATRYQVYLYELGYSYAVNGKQTLYPVPDDLPSGYTVVTSPGANVPVYQSAETSSTSGKPHKGTPNYTSDPNYDGVPQSTVASNGYARRLVRVALLNCAADGVQGSGDYETYGRFAEFFITETMDGGGNAYLYGEFVRMLTPSNDEDYHANVALVQ